MRRLMAALVMSWRQPVKRGAIGRMFEDVEGDEEEDVCDMVEDKEEMGESKLTRSNRSKTRVETIEFGRDVRGKEDVKEDEKVAASMVQVVTNNDDNEEFGTPEGKLKTKKGDVEAHLTRVTAASSAEREKVEK